MVRSLQLALHLRFRGTRYMDRNPQGKEAKTMNNAAAIGYMIIAAKWLELDPKTIKKLDRAMYEAMDEVTEEEAEEVYQNT